MFAQNLQKEFKGLRSISVYLANIYLFKGNNRNTRESCEICTAQQNKWLVSI